MGSEPIASEKVSIDRKMFFLDLKENQRGRFLKITEDVGGRRHGFVLAVTLQVSFETRHQENKRTQF